MELKLVNERKSMTGKSEVVLPAQKWEIDRTVNGTCFIQILGGGICPLICAPTQNSEKSL